MTARRDMALEILIIRAAGMALAHHMPPTNNHQIRIGDIETIRTCFEVIDDSPIHRRRVIDFAVDYTRRAEPDGQPFVSERREVERRLHEILDYKA